MATYQLIGSQDPASRIDRVIVEEPTEDNPGGKTLELNGDPVELSEEQYEKLSGILRLQPIVEEETPAPPASPPAKKETSSRTLRDSTQEA